jgi:hypothetical protein
MSYIKVVRNDIILLNMNSNYIFVPLPKKLLPLNQMPDLIFSLLAKNFLGKGTNM